MDYIGIGITILGLAAGWLLFCRLRQLPPAGAQPAQHSISVVIPARNEAHNLPGLLQDLAAQTTPVHEVLCVDDASEDGTATVAKENGARVIRIEEKPAGWTGKSFACHTGAEAATGQQLLFLDADVRLAPNAVAALVQAQAKYGPVVSVQPRHITKRWYEQLCLFFNLIVASSLGAALPFGKTAGVFGPVLLLPAQLYAEIGGHGSVKQSILEDMSLGEKLSEQGIVPHRCVGGASVAFRMYPEGARSMFEGWTKNFATGAMKVSLPFLLLVIVWITALSRTPLRLITGIVQGDMAIVLVYGVLYLLVAALLLWQAHKVGRFWVAGILLYPIALLYFIVVFAVSLYKKLFRRPVRWKGRNLTAED